MPAWEMHIAIANRVNERLNLDEELFIFGNVMPDAEGYVVKNPSVIVPYRKSHFAENGIEGVKEVLSNYQSFAIKYKKYKGNSIVMGYFTHLLTDFYWNRLTFKDYYIKDENSETIGIKLNDGKHFICDKDTRRILKQTDFKMFSDFLVNTNKIYIPRFNIEEILENIKFIEEIPINKTDVEKTIEFLNNINKKREKLNREYKVFTQEKFEAEFENCIKFIFEEINRFM